MSAVRRLRLLAPAPAPVRKPGAWGPLAAPVDPGETTQRMRAQSALCGLRFRDGSTNPDTFTCDQAQDVLRWYRPLTPAPPLRGQAVASERPRTRQPGLT